MAHQLTRASLSLSLGSHSPAPSSLRSCLACAVACLRLCLLWLCSCRVGGSPAHSRASAAALGHALAACRVGGSLAHSRVSVAALGLALAFALVRALVFSPQPQLPKACLSPTAGRVPSTASCLRHGSSNNEEITCISGQQDGGATSAAWICAIAKRLDLRRGGCCSFLVCKEEKIAAKPLLLPRYLMEARIWVI